MDEDSSQLEKPETAPHNLEAEVEAGEEETDPESNSLRQPLLKRNRTLSASQLAIVGAKVSHIQSLDYE